MSVFPLTLPVKVLLLGSGELGKELTISLQRLGCPVVACDSYAGAPAMQVASESRVLDMADATKLAALIAEVKPDLVVPEVEKLAPEPLEPRCQSKPTGILRHPATPASPEPWLCLLYTSPSPRD